MGYEILFYVPNVIGYIRLVLLVLSWIIYHSNPIWSIGLYSVSTIMDGLDGYLARKLNQTSAFGAWFDVVIDILGRGMLWSKLYSFGYFMAAIEWTTFVCTHSLGAQWKASFIQAPWWVNKVMANGFKTPLGTIVIAGIHVLPIWLYAHYFSVLHAIGIPLFIQYTGIALLSAGRALCMAVELWTVSSHVKYLLSDEANKPKATNS